MRTQSRKGFTIIELLVAVGVTALLVTLMINIVTTVLTNWNRTSGTLSSGNQARLVLDQISQDLQGAILKTDGNVWLAATVQATGSGANVSGEDWNGGKPNPADEPEVLELNPSSSSLEDYRFGQAGVWLRFFTIPSGENDGTTDTISAPRAVAYQISRRRVGGSGSSFVYQLFRSEVLPYSDDASKAAASTFTVGYDLYTTKDPGYNEGDGTVAGVAGNIRRPHISQVIASGVVDFGVRLFATDSTSNNTVEVFPVDRRGGGATGRVLIAASSAESVSAPSSQSGEPSSPITQAFPTVAEVMIRVLTPEGIRLIEALEEGLPVSGTWWEIVEQNSNVYTRRIDLKATAL